MAWICLRGSVLPQTGTQMQEIYSICPVGELVEL